MSNCDLQLTKSQEQSFLDGFYAAKIKDKFKLKTKLPKTKI